MLIYKAFGWVYHINNLTFSNHNSIKKSYFFWCLILGLIFQLFGVSWCQNARFREPLGTQVGPKWRPKSPKWRQNGVSFSTTVPLFCRLASKVAFGPFLGTSLVDFGWILKTVCIICNKNCILGGIDFEWILKTWSSAIPPGTNIKQNNQHKTNTSSDYEHVRKVLISIVGP